MKLIFALIVIVFVLLLCWVFSDSKTKRYQEYEFNFHYLRIQEFIRKAEVTPENYDIIMRMFGTLNKCKYRNKEKKEVLFVTEFLTKFKGEAKKRIDK